MMATPDASGGKIWQAAQELCFPNQLSGSSRRKIESATKKKKFRPYQPDQLMLLPPSLSDWLPKDHEVDFEVHAVDSMDRRKIYSRYNDLQGRPPNEPPMMVKVLVQSYRMGVRSARRLEKTLHEDVGFGVLHAISSRGFAHCSL